MKKYNIKFGEFFMKIKLKKYNTQITMIIKEIKK